MLNRNIQTRKKDQPAETSEKAKRRQVHALRNLTWVAASYSLDFLLIFSFASIGTVGFSLAYGFLSAGCLACILTYSLIKRNISFADGDYNLSALQMTFGTLIMTAGILLEPRLAFLFFNILFTNFAFGTLRLNTRQTLIGWLLMTCVAGLAVLQVWPQLGIPHENANEAFLVFITYALTLLKFIAVGQYGTLLRSKVHQQNEKLAAASAEISRLANYDHLTSALNRRGLFARAEHEYILAIQEESQFSLILFDLDHFKSINDTYGHQEGDRVLQSVAEITRGSIREYDLFGRIGGEEFLIVLPRTSLDEAKAVANRIRHKISEFVFLSQPYRMVTASFGVAKGQRGCSFEKLQDAADKALYQAKEQGRNQVVCIQDWDQVSKAKAELGEDFSTSIRTKTLSI